MCIDIRKRKSLNHVVKYTLEKYEGIDNPKTQTSLDTRRKTKKMNTMDPHQKPWVYLGAPGW